jgi:hypothetical protein
MHAWWTVLLKELLLLNRGPVLVASGYSQEGRGLAHGDGRGRFVPKPYGCGLAGKGQGNAGP